MNRYTPPATSLAVQLANLRGQKSAGDRLGEERQADLAVRCPTYPREPELPAEARLRAPGVARDSRHRPEPACPQPRVAQFHICTTRARARLCLYLPKTGEWHDRRLLSGTIVPWSILWLLYFEEWLASDDWKGGGAHLTAA